MMTERSTMLAPVESGDQSHIDSPGSSSSGRQTLLETSSLNTAAQGSQSGERNPHKHRVFQACLRCRKQKSRCSGSHPCDRCVKSRHICSFATAASSEGLSPTLSKHVEASVARFLANLSDQRVHEDTLAALLSNQGTFSPPLSQGSQQVTQPPEILAPVGVPLLPPPTHTRPLETPRIGINLNSAISQTSAHRVTAGSPPSPPNAPNTASVGSFVDSLQLDLVINGARTDTLPADAADSLYQAPFRSLLPQSERETPVREIDVGINRSSYHTRLCNGDDDPINTGIIDESLSRKLFDFFVEHCHPFLPIVAVADPDAYATTSRSAPLSSAISAVACRFYRQYLVRFHPLVQPPDASVPSRLANLAETHLARTLVRRHYALTDVQTILLLAAWSLKTSDGASGPDAWVATGHAARVARRIGVHRVLSQVTETARQAEQGSDEWRQLERFLPQWRTWLCWFTFDGSLSLDFGRPQSTQFETVDEFAFLQLRLHQGLRWPGSKDSLSLVGDIYIAGQVQLTQIGRDLINWGEMLADPTKAVLADPRRASVFADKDLSLSSMLRELNSRLEEWSRLWIWADSPYRTYLGSSSRLATLQAEHLRLCINSYALNGEPEKDVWLATCLRSALDAVVKTIQTHHESTQTDRGLSFANDHLIIALAQAAVFLIRISAAPQLVQDLLSIDSAVLSHYLQKTLVLLETSDMSETLLGTNLAKTVKEMGRAAKLITPEAPLQGASFPTQMDDLMTTFDPNGLNASEPFNLDDLFLVQSDFAFQNIFNLPNEAETRLESFIDSHGQLVSTGFGFGLGEVGATSGEVVGDDHVEAK